MKSSFPESSGPELPTPRLLATSTFRDLFSDKLSRTESTRNEKYQNAIRGCFPKPFATLSWQPLGLLLKVKLLVGYIRQIP